MMELVDSNSGILVGRRKWGFCGTLDLLGLFDQSSKMPLKNALLVHTALVTGNLHRRTKVHEFSYL